MIPKSKGNLINRIKLLTVQLIILLIQLNQKENRFCKIAAFKYVYR
jgi:hypothetical protein